jgi:Ca2+-binding RTX toxin-like protein
MCGRVGTVAIGGHVAVIRVPGDFASLAAAVASASVGDTIDIAAGYPGGGSVTVTVDNLLFNAPAGVSSISLFPGSGVSTIRLSGDSNLRVFGNANANVIVGNAGNNVLTGAEGDDQIFGGDGSDDLYGDGDNDRLDGGNGDDRLIGGSGNDRLIGGAGRDAAIYEDSTGAVSVNLLTGIATDGMGGIDTLSEIEAVHGSRFNDTIVLGNASGYVYGRAGNDTITGGAGDDEFYGGSGADTIDGGAGNDTVSYLDDGYDSAGRGTSGVTVNLATGKAKDNWGKNDTLANIENVTGSSLDDTITGDDARNILSGGQGNDTLKGGDGNDALYGGDGNDRLNGDQGDDALSGGAGDDRIDGGAGRDHVTYEDAASGVTVNLRTGTATDGLGGTDTISNVEGVIGGRFADVLTLGNVDGFAYGRGGDDTITGGTANDFLYGGSGADRLDGGTGVDTVSYLDDGLDTAGAGWRGVYVELHSGRATDNWGNIDTLANIENVHGSRLADTLAGNAGNNILNGDAGNDTLYGEDGNDTLNGGDGDDWMFSGADNDKLNGGAGNDWIDGGLGQDIVTYEDAGAGVTVDLLTGVASDGLGGTDQLANVEGVIGGRYDDLLTLGNFAGIAFGRSGADTITGGDADDQINGGSGADRIDGGAGIDTVSYADDGLDGAGAGTRGVTVNLKKGTATDNWGNTDTLVGIENVTGSSLDDRIFGDRGNNILRGGAGDDVLKGRRGDDILAGGAGFDTLNGGAGFDIVTYEDSATGVTVDIPAGTAADGWDDTDTLIKIEGVIGSSFNDTLRLGHEGGYASGRAGNDKILGGDGADMILGGAGNDKIDGGAGIDTVSYADDGTGIGVQGVTADLTTGKATDNWGDKDTLSNIQNLIGSAFGDTLTGDAIANVLDGGAGDDRLDGRGGADLLIGGAGADTFAFSSTLGGGNIDTIADFVSGLDHIELSKSVFKALDTGTLSASVLAQASAAMTPQQRIVYNETTGVLSYDADGSGSGKAVAFAQLQPGQSLTASDFRVV